VNKDKAYRRIVKAVIILVVLTASLAVHAQGQMILKGKVSDVKTGEPLPYATLSVKHRPLGTITNMDGEFELYLPTTSAEDTLLAFMLGYNSYAIRITEIKDFKYMRIQLEVRPVLLNEVVIVAKKVDPKEIVRRALKSINKNYPQYPSLLKGFYRETYEENNRTVILAEAALDIYDNGYQKSRPEKVILTNSRSSKSYRNGAFANTVVERWNLAAAALNHNPIKHRDRFISTAKEFLLDSVLYYDDRLVYAISFLSYIARFPNFERRNTLYIDAQNFAIYKYGWEEYAKEGKYSEVPWRLSEESIYFSKRKRISTIYEFGEYEGKMFLKYFDEKAYDDIYNSKGDSVEFESLGHVTLVVTEIVSQKVKIEATETMRRDQSVRSQVKGYNPEFWSNMNNIALVPLTRKQVKDLEREMSLEDQFKKGIN
jgi:hypothetical protein